MFFSDISRGGEVEAGFSEGISPSVVSSIVGSLGEMELDGEGVILCVPCDDGLLASAFAVKAMGFPVSGIAVPFVEDTDGPNVSLVDISGESISEYIRDFYEDFDPNRAQNMLLDLKIDPKAKLKTLSKGMKEKVQLVMVMSRRAKLYLLDEPIAGVDPAARDYILSTIIRNYDQDATILITTHLIHDVENVLDEFYFMSYDGHIFMSGSVDEVRAEKQKSLDELFREVYKC